MTKEQQQQSLANARRACLLLADYALGADLLILGDPHREAVACLLEEFGRLDKAEQRSQEHARKIGKTGGRPRLKTPSAAALAKRRQRAKKP